MYFLIHYSVSLLCVLSLYVTIGKKGVRAISTVQYRNVKRKDIPIIEKMVTDSWQFSKYTNDHTLLHLMSYAFVYYYLSESTFGKVAIMDNRIVGCVFGNCKKVSSLGQKLYYKPRIVNVGMKMKKYLEGSDVLQISHATNIATQDMLQPYTSAFEGELLLLVTDERVRGMGIGKALFAKYKEYLASYEMSHFYFITDTLCNYGFYDSMKCHRIDSRKISFPTRFGNYEEEIFLYEYGENK